MPLLNRHDDLRRQLEALHLDAMAQSFAEFALRGPKRAYRMEPISTNWSSISENGESSGSCIKQTCPPEKTFRTLELNAFPATLRLQLERLKSGAFLKESTNVIALGKPGVGKSHDLAAVAYELAHAGHSVLWTATSTQVQRLLAASTCAAWRVRT